MDAHTKAVANRIKKEIREGTTKGVFRCVCGRWRGWYLVGDEIRFTEHAMMFEGAR